MSQIFDEIKQKVTQNMEKVISSLKDELGQIRTGRANPSLLNKIRVDYYGSPTELKHIASISVPDPKTLLIQPRDKSILTTIEKAILKSDLGLPPNNDGKVIRLKIPDLTQERREELVKQARKKGEEKKVAIRNFRRDGNEAVKKAEKDGKLPKDEAKDGLEKLQKLTDGYVDQAEEMVKNKEKDMLSF